MAGLPAGGGAAMTGEKARQTASTQLEEKLLAQIDAASSVNLITTRELLAELADLKAEVKRLCQAGEGDKAKRLTELAVSRLRTGEAAKE
jgi:hypothetical protein